jgi:hypothetical protein
VPKLHLLRASIAGILEGQPQRNFGTMLFFSPQNERAENKIKKKNNFDVYAFMVFISRANDPATC